MLGRTLVLVGAFAASMGFGIVGAGCASDGETADTGGATEAREPRDLRSAGRIQAASANLYRLADYAAALEGYKEVLRRWPGSARAQYDVGRTKLALGREIEAREHLTVALEIEPDSAEFLDGLVDAMLATGEVDELFTLLEARAADGNGAEEYLRMGRAAERYGLVDEAETALLKSVAFDVAGSSPAQRALADLYRAVGDAERELERLRVLLHFTPLDVSVRSRIEALGEVPGPSLALRPEQVD